MTLFFRVLLNPRGPVYTAVDTAVFCSVADIRFRRNHKPLVSSQL